MSNASRPYMKWLMVSVALGMLAAFGVSALGQEADNTSAQGGSYVDDWSHHHLIFSNPGTEQDAIKSGHYAEWQKITSDPRYQLHVAKRRGTLPVMPDPNLVMEPGRWGGPPERPIFPITLHPVAGSPIKKDWSQALGGVVTSLVSTLATTNSASTVSASSTITVGNQTFTGNAPTSGTAAVTVLCTGGGSCASTPADPSEISHTSVLGVGAVSYTVAATGSTVSSAALVSNTNGSDAGPDADQMALNFAAAINNSAQSACGATPSVGGGCYCATDNSCTSGIAAPNVEITSATVSGNVITLTGNGAVPLSCTTTAFDFAVPSNGTAKACSTTALSGSDGADSSTGFKYTTNGAYDTGSNLATDLHTALAANATVATTDAITATAGTNEITFATTTAGPYAISATNFPGFTGVGTISDTAIPATVQPNAYPAKYGASLISASCASSGTPDFVVYPTGQAGSASAANIIAYDNLYSGCTGTVPTVYWAFNTANSVPGNAVTTSPIISQDGSKVAFIQSNGTNSYLVVLKWTATGTLTSPDTIASSSSNIATCIAPCMTVTQLSNLDTYSSPFYVYSTADTLFVGDNSGYLEEFTPVFNGAVAGPTTLSLGSFDLTSPVFDAVSGCVFVGDTEGYLYKVNSGIAGSVCTATTFSANVTSTILGDGSANQGIFDGVLLDPVAEEVYAFVTASKAITATGTCAALNNCVAEFATSFGSGAAPARVEPVGTGAAGYNLYAGSFDNVYYESAASPPTGNLYVVGGTHATTGATLYRITITGGVMTAVASAVTGINSTEYPWPSPATEFCNNGTSACAITTGGTCGTGVTCTTAGTDYLFFSVNRGAQTGCTNAAGSGCILAYNISTTSPVEAGSGLNVTTPASPGCWATGGLVIDNSATATTGAQQIYFVNLNGASSSGSASCATGTTATMQGVQASQTSP